MIGLAREMAVAAVALTAYIPCPSTGCGRRRYSPLILRARW